MTVSAAFALVLTFGLSFFIGSANPAAIAARILGKDVRGSGSGNPGATNAGRVLGRSWGVAVGVLDILKGFLPVVIVLPAMGVVAACAAGLGVVLGHMFSPFLRGRGGKGVATSFGAILALMPWVGLVAVVGFVLMVRVVRTVGEASLLICAALIVTGGVIASGTGAPALAPSPLAGWWLVLVGLLVLSRHRRNLRVAIAKRRRKHL